MVQMKKFGGIRNYFGLNWLGQQKRGESICGADRMEMTFSIGVQREKGETQHRQRCGRRKGYGEFGVEVLIFGSYMT